MQMTTDKKNKKNKTVIETESHFEEPTKEEIISKGEVLEGSSEGVETPEEVVEKNPNDEVIDMKDIFNKKRETADKIKKLENENDTLKDRLQRISAEYENFRKRSLKEKEGLYADSISDVVKELLPVLDNLEKSLKIEVADVDGLKKGVDMTLSQFKSALEKLKVTEIDTDTPFDPNYHSAVIHEDDASFGEKKITEVFMKGYQREDKIIRYSVVKVAN